MKLYKIEKPNGDTQTATSIGAAIKTARKMLGVRRIFRGAEYWADDVYALDIWTTRKDATEERGGNAPVVISWR